MASTVERVGDERFLDPDADDPSPPDGDGVHEDLGGHDGHGAHEDLGEYDDHDDYRDDESADPDRPVMAVERWRRRTASGALATAIAMGLQQVFQPALDRRPAIVLETAGEPYSDDDPVVVDFEPDAPEGTTVLLRPWNR